MAETLPRDFGPYVLQRLISDEGGQGKVYLATHKSLGRVAVIKLLRQHLAEHPSFVERFAAEAAQLAKMDHANIVRVRQSGPLEEQFFIEMEYVEGWDLSAWLKAQGAVPYEVVVAMLQRIAAGLEHAHARFVIHRDVKPGNIILTPGGEVKVLDFGLAREMDASGSSTPGTLVGTVAYMSPEQVDGVEATESFDIYALGVVAYQLLAGRLPFEGGLATVCMKIRSEPPPPLQKACPEAPPELVKLVARLMAKQSADRPAEMRDVEAELRALALTLGLRASDDLLARYVADPAAVVRELAQRRRARVLRARMPALVAVAVVLVAVVAAAVMYLRMQEPASVAAALGADSAAVPAVTEVLAAPETLSQLPAQADAADSIAAAAAAPRTVTDAAVPLEEEPVVPAPVTPPAPSGTLAAAPVAPETETDSPDSLLVEVEVQPASDVYLDGTLVASGVTSFRKRMLRRTWQVRVDGGAYGVREQKKKPRAGDRRLAFSFKLSAGVGGVHVSGPRNGLDIYIDGVYQHAVTPAPVRPVPVGTHTIDVRDRRTGTVVASRQVVVKQDSNNLEVDLSVGH
ncbi:MAG: serine/threonine-protein kinase [Candidatus Eisenbacteria bacterium]